jgi:endoplasmic reticulum resident protein 44
MLAPIFDEAADRVAAEFPESGQVVMGKVDCDKEGMDVHVEHQIKHFII